MKCLDKHFTLGNGKTKINIQKHLFGFQVKQVKKHFVADYATKKPLQLGNMGIKALRTLGKRSSHITKIEANKSQSTLPKSLESSASKK